MHIWYLRVQDCLRKPLLPGLNKLKVEKPPFVTVEAKELPSEMVEAKELPSETFEVMAEDPPRQSCLCSHWN